MRTLTFSDPVRKHTLALELARLDELEEVFLEQAKGGDVQAARLVTKIIERRCLMLSLHALHTAALQVVDASAPRQTSRPIRKGSRTPRLP
jgi:hypothetical protein